MRGEPLFVAENRRYESFSNETRAASRNNAIISKFRYLSRPPRFEAGRAAGAHNAIGAMPITNQRAADGRCDVRRSDVILLILCRSTCVHGALLTTLSPPPLSTRRNFGERSDAGVATREYVRARPMDSAGG